MADINIERRAPSVWPWVLGLLVLALLIWALVEMFGARGEPVDLEPAPVDTTPLLPAIPSPIDTVVPGGAPADTFGAMTDTAVGAMPDTAGGGP